MTTWSERHPIIAGILATAGLIILGIIGFLALFLLIETVASISSEFWSGLQP